MVLHMKYVSENMHWPCKRKEWNILVTTLPSTIPREGTYYSLPFNPHNTTFRSIAISSLLLNTFILIESKYSDPKFNDPDIMRHGPLCKRKSKTKPTGTPIISVKCHKNHRKGRTEGRSTEYHQWKDVSKANIYWSCII